MHQRSESFAIHQDYGISSSCQKGCPPFRQFSFHFDIPTLGKSQTDRSASPPQNFQSFLLHTNSYISSALCAASVQLMHMRELRLSLSLLSSRAPMEGSPFHHFSHQGSRILRFTLCRFYDWLLSVFFWRELLSLFKMHSPMHVKLQPLFLCVGSTLDPL